MSVSDDRLHCPAPFDSGGPARIVVDFSSPSVPESRSIAPRTCLSKIGTSILARLAPSGRGYAITRYRSYPGIFDYDEESDAFVGHVMDMRGVVEIEGKSVEELRDSMKCVVDQRIGRPFWQPPRSTSLEEWVGRVYEGNVSENESQLLCWEGEVCPT